MITSKIDSTKNIFSVAEDFVLLGVPEKVYKYILYYYICGI